MAWEKRGNQMYYYTAERVDRRVVKRYCGSVSNEVSAACALFEQGSREVLAALRANERSLRLTVDNSMQAFESACHRAERLSSLLVVASGYHRHDRGRWRKQQMRTKAKTALVPMVPVTEEEQRQVVRAALDDKDNAALQARAVAILEQNPRVYVSTALNDVQRALRAYLPAGTSSVTRQLRAEEARQMRRNLCSGQDPGTLPYAERLLVERVVASQIALHYYEAAAAVSSTIGPLRRAEFCQRNLDRAHKRYLQSIKALAEVRRLALPSVNVALPGTVQVNLGEKQINLVSP